MRYYPIFLNLTNQRVVIIGAGYIAEGKLTALLDADAKVHMIAPEARSPKVQEMITNGQVTWEQRPYQDGDLAGAMLAIGATNNPEVNHLVWEEANRLGILINVVDDVPYCNFIAPAVVKRGDITLAISTNGKMPALAAHMRRAMDKSFGDEYLELLDMTYPLRQELGAKRLPYDVRQELWRKLFDDTEMIALIRAGKPQEALQLAREVLGL